MKHLLSTFMLFSLLEFCGIFFCGVCCGNYNAGKSGSSHCGMIVATAPAAIATPAANKGDTAWMIVATVLVILNGHTRIGIVLWRHGARQEHAVRADASVCDFFDDGLIVGRFTVTASRYRG